MRSLLLSAVAVLSVVSVAHAAPSKKLSGRMAPSTASINKDYVSISAGVFDIIDDDENEFQFGVEYRFKEWDFGVRPTLGVTIQDEGGVYAFAGFNWDVAIIPEQLYLIPNVMVGGYHQSDSKDLGGALEFRSGIELAYQFENQHRLGLAFNHISNASIYDKNPGSESVMINYQVPALSIFGY